MVPNAQEQKVYYFYTKDTSTIAGPGGKLVKNPTKAKERPRRTVIAGVLVGNHLHFGKAECGHRDIFVKKVGRDKARGRALSESRCIMKLEVNNATEIGRLFVLAAQDIVKPIITY